MKKILNALFLTIITLVTFSCSDVPAPYDINGGGNGEGPALTGDGTKENPYDIASAMTKQDNSEAWVMGYIVGCINDKSISTDAVFAPPFTNAANILIAADADETDYKKCIPVQLVGGSDVRTALNLKDNEGNLGKAVVIKGQLTKYFGVAGLKNTTAAVFDGKDIGDGGDTPSGDLASLLDPSNPVAEVTNTFADAVADTDYKPAGYVNFAEAGGRTWRGKADTNSNMLIQATAYGANQESVISWFVTPALNVDQMAVKKLTFDCVSAYYVEGTGLEVYFLEKNGETLTQTKLNVGTLPQKADGYSDPVTLSADLTALAGKIGFIGFKYIGGGTATGTYQIDNLYVGKEAGGVDPDPDPEENTVFTETFGEVVSANTNVAAFTGWDNKNLTFEVADAKCNICAKAHMTEANRTETAKVNSIWFPSNNTHSFTISGIDASKYSKFIVKYELGANVSNTGSSIDLNVLKVALNDVEGTVASKVVSKDNGDANVFFEMQAEVTVQGTATSVLKFSAVGADNTMGLLLYNIRLIGVENGGTDPEPSGDNLLINPGFEDWTAELPTAWDNKTYNTSVTKETSIKHSGNNSVKHTSGSSTVKLQQEVAIEAGKKYKISYWYLDNDVNARNRMWSFWVDAANKTLANHKDELRDGAPYSEDSPEWKQFSVTLTAPAGAVKFRFEVRTYKGTTDGGAVYYDDMEISEVK